MSHPAAWGMKLFLTSPSGIKIDLLNGRGGNSNDIMTIFSDNADSTATSEFTLLPSFGISAPFSPSIKPDQALSAFNGQNRNGWWKLEFFDQLGGGDIGYVHGWGINLKSYRSLDLTALLQGFYDPSINIMKSDTAQIIIRIPLPPYPKVDSAKAVLDSNGKAKFYFSNVVNGIGYYLVLKHRNSIETWSAVGNAFTSDTSYYNFTTSNSQAFGSNQTQVNTSPIKYAIYGGDTNHDGVVDATDAGAIDNDAAAFVTGYVNTDVTGDDVVDAADAALVDNNAANFVGKITP